MIKLLVKKIKSLTEKQITILIIILVLIHLGMIIFWFNLWTNLQKTQPPTVKQSSPIAESLKPGEIGEPTEGEEPLIELPTIISNTSGGYSFYKDCKNERILWCLQSLR